MFQAHPPNLRDRLTTKRDAFEVQIRKRYHSVNRAIRRQAIMHHQLTMCTERFVDSYEADKDSSETHQALSELANMLLAGQLKQSDIEVVNDTLLFVTLNRLVAHSRSATLVELTLEIQATLTGYESYGVYLDDLRDFCVPILDTFEQLSPPAKLNVLWCLSNMLGHSESHHLIRMLSAPEFYLPANDLLRRMIAVGKFEEDEVESVVRFGTKYLEVCGKEAALDKSLAHCLADVASEIVKSALRRNDLSQSLSEFCSQIFMFDSSFLDGDEEVLELLLAGVHHTSHVGLLLTLVEAQPTLRTFIAVRLLSKLQNPDSDPQKIDNILNVLNHTLEQCQYKSRNFYAELVESKIGSAQLIELNSICSGSVAFQHLLVHLLEATNHPQIYQPVLEELDKRSCEQSMDSRLLAFIDEHLNGIDQ